MFTRSSMTLVVLVTIAATALIFSTGATFVNGSSDPIDDAVALQPSGNPVTINDGEVSKPEDEKSSSGTDASQPTVSSSLILEDFVGLAALIGTTFATLFLDPTRAELIWYNSYRDVTVRDNAARSRAVVSRSPQ